MVIVIWMLIFEVAPLLCRLNRSFIMYCAGKIVPLLCRLNRFFIMQVELPLYYVLCRLSRSFTMQVELLVYYAGWIACLLCRWNPSFNIQVESLLYYARWIASLLCTLNRSFIMHVELLVCYADWIACYAGGINPLMCRLNCSFTMYVGFYIKNQINKRNWTLLIPKRSLTCLETFSQDFFKRNIAEQVNAVIIPSNPLKLCRQRHVSATIAHFSITLARAPGVDLDKISEAIKRLVWKCNIKILHIVYISCF